MVDFDELLNVVKNEKDLELFLTHEDKYEYLYNFSLVRHNILEWYDFDSDASLLEMGAECGALTGLFCQKVKTVVALEENEKKCEINKARNSEYDNLTILSDYNSIDDKYDYVTIIGGFDIEKLNKAKDYLKDNGTLIIAIENKYGIKYWAGSSDDNTEMYFDSIEGYKEEDVVRSYSKDSLDKIIKDVGFKETSFYYPVPDYILPMEIYSPKYLPKSGSIMSMSPSYKKERYEVFDEVKAINSICDDDMFEQFANSFLVICN